MTSGRIGPGVHGAGADGKAGACGAAGYEGCARAFKESYAILVATSSSLFSDTPGITPFNAVFNLACSAASSTTSRKEDAGGVGSTGFPDDVPPVVILGGGADTRLKKGFGRHHLARSALEPVIPRVTSLNLNLKKTH